MKVTYPRSHSCKRQVSKSVLPDSKFQLCLDLCTEGTRREAGAPHCSRQQHGHPKSSHQERKLIQSGQRWKGSEESSRQKIHFPSAAAGGRSQGQENQTAGRWQPDAVVLGEGQGDPVPRPRGEAEAWDPLLRLRVATAMPTSYHPILPTSSSGSPNVLQCPFKN